MGLNKRHRSTIINSSPLVFIFKIVIKLENMKIIFKYSHKELSEDLGNIFAIYRFSLTYFILN